MTVVASGVAGIALAFVLTMGHAPKYVSEATLLVDLRQLEVTSTSLVPNAPADLLETLVNSERSRLISQNVLEQVVNKHDLQLIPEFGGSSGAGMIFSALKQSAGLGGGSLSDKKAVAAAKLRKKLTVKRKKDSLVLEVAVASEDPERAQMLARSILDFYLASRSRDTQQATSSILSALQGQLSDQVKRLTQAEEAVERYKIQNNIIGSNGQLNEERQVSTVVDQLNAAQLETAQLLSRYNQAKRAIKQSLTTQSSDDSFNSGVITDLRTRLTAAQEELAGLRSIYGPAHPRIKTTALRVASLENSLRSEMRKSLLAIEQDLKRAREVEASLSKELAKVEGVVGEANQKKVPLRELERRVEAARSVYVSTLTRIREIKSQQGIDTSNVRVLSDPVLPLDSQAVSRKMLLILGGLIGASIGALIAFFTAQKPSRKLDGDLIAGMTGLPLLADLPVVSAQRASSRRRDGGILLPRLFGHHEPSGRRVEAMEELYRALRFGSGTSRRTGPDVLLLTSLQEEDSSVYAANLASLACEDGDKVLMIVDDAERLPFSEFLACLPQGSSVATGPGRPSRGVRKDWYVNYCLTGSRGNAGTRQLKEQFEDLSVAIREYDLVLIDGQNFAASPAFDFYAELASQIVLLAGTSQERGKKSGKTALAQMQAALQKAYLRFGEARDKVSGIVYLSEAGQDQNKLYDETLTLQDLPLQQFDISGSVRQEYEVEDHDEWNDDLPRETVSGRSLNRIYGEENDNFEADYEDEYDRGPRLAMVGNKLSVRGYRRRR